jgi:hypothetical protein
MARRPPEETWALLSASAERHANSPPGLRATAADLRSKAIKMTDSNDRDAMLRLAAGYEQRANEALRRAAADSVGDRFASSLRAR